MEVQCSRSVNPSLPTRPSYKLFCPLINGCHNLDRSFLKAIEQKENVEWYEGSPYNGIR